MSSSDTSVSIPHDTCIPISYGLNFAHLPLFASRTVNFERFTVGRLSYIPGIVKLWESPGIAGGLLRGIYKAEAGSTVRENIEQYRNGEIEPITVPHPAEESEVERQKRIPDQSKVNTPD